MINYTSELAVKAGKAESVEDLVRMAGEENIALERKEAEEIYNRLHMEGEFNDDELDGVCGGSCSHSAAYSCPRCGSALTGVYYYDNVDNTRRAYYLCYGCRKYGARLEGGTLWALPDNFVSWILDRAVKE